MADAKQYEALDKYVLRLIRESSPERTVWNVEKLRQGVPTNWNYIDGCMMTALLSLYHITGDKAYFDFVEGFIGAFVGEDGSIRTLKTEGHALDDINEGRVLFELYQATGKEKYRRAADSLKAMLDAQPRTFEGSWWHKQIYPDQVWLDGIYMAQPFSALYEKTFGAGDFSDVLRQVLLVRDRMRDQRTGLYYHGYDASRKAFWCDVETGLSQSFWLRAIGWFSVALADLIEILPEKDAGPVRDIFADLMRSLVPFADGDTGMYAQVVDQPLTGGNYLETSGSAMIAYAMLKGARLKALPEEYASLGQKTFDGIVSTQLSFTDDELNLNSICLVAGLGPENNRRRDGSVAYYLSEPIVQNDAKGVAPLLMCYTEIKRR
ncbi:MAG: glycoside hydrolase family 88 protein [Clostridia bacterium]|nr:glycoside hydrolase family 88 protein [Clostridia bacterium]